MKHRIRKMSEIMIFTIECRWNSSPVYIKLEKIEKRSSLSTVKDVWLPELRTNSSFSDLQYKGWSFGRYTAYFLWFFWFNLQPFSLSFFGSLKSESFRETLREFSLLFSVILHVLTHFSYQIRDSHLMC